MLKKLIKSLNYSNNSSILKIPALQCYRIKRNISYSFRCNSNSSSNIIPNSRISDKLKIHLNGIENRYKELSDKLSNELSPSDLAKLGKEFAELSRVVTVIEELNEAQKLLKDLIQLEKEENEKGEKRSEEMLELVKFEKEEAQSKLIEVEDKMIHVLTPRDEADDKSVVLEVRAGTGGDEASLFASEIFKMYQKFSLLNGWKWEELSLSKTDIGGFKEAQASINGEAVFKLLKFESGVHRVQRVPINDTKIQTSAASVIVLPEAEEVDVNIRPQDLRIDVFRAGGAGGQSVNKTESAVRITHIPTGLVVSMQDERSQIQNRARAMKYLRAKIYDYERQKKDEQRQELKSAAGGTGDRSDKIRTYNFPQDRVTDHRISSTVTGVDRVLSGEMLSNLLYDLVKIDENERLKNFLKSLKG